MRLSDSSSDQELLAAARSGDTSAFAVLWERHHRPALVAAQSFTTHFAAEDIVAEAYLKIFELISAGKGPTGAFRPYLYRVVRSVAVDWLRKQGDSSLPFDESLILTENDPWDDDDFDRNAVAQAFKSLNPRWQEVLWYVEVEGLTPQETAKLIGTNARNVSALASRSRKELRSAWVEEHVNRELATGACRFTLEHLQRYQRGKLTAGLSRDVEAHLAHCENCTNAAAEYSTLNRQLALVLSTIFFGGISASSLLSAFGHSAADTSLAIGATQSVGATVHNPSKSPLKMTAGAGSAKTLAVIGAANVAAAIAIGTAVFVMSPSPEPSTAAEDEVSVTSYETEHAEPEQEDQDKSETSPTPPVQPPNTSPPEPDTDKPDTDKPDTDKPDTDKPDTDKPDTDKPDNENESPHPDEDDDEIDPNLDSSISIGFQCYLDSPGLGYTLTGTASEYGAIRARITQPPATEPVLLIASPTVTDSYGNTFENILTGTDPMPVPWWFTPSITPLDQWPGLVPGNIEDVLIELQFLTPDGRYSPWTPVSLNSSC